MGLEGMQRRALSGFYDAVPGRESMRNVMEDGNYCLSKEGIQCYVNSKLALFRL